MNMISKKTSENLKQLFQNLKQRSIQSRKDGKNGFVSLTKKEHEIIKHTKFLPHKEIQLKS